MRDLDKAKRLLMDIDAEEQISEEAQIANQIRSVAQLNRLMYQEHLRVGFTKKQAMEILMASLAAPDVNVNIGRGEE